MQDLRQFLSTKSSHARFETVSLYNFCFCFSRMFRLKMADPPEDVANLFKEYSDNGVMTVENLHKFLIDFQREDNSTVDDAQTILNSLKHLHVFQRRGLSLHAFFRYLFGDLNSPISIEVHHDMEAPLAHYFLYTGHNSYLTGDQLTSNSSIEPIIKALKAGVRVIELDLWPSKKGDVEVRHGGTLTSSIELVKCLDAIKENAFYASEYPVIITFEDHLTPVLQKRVAEMVTTTFGEMLYPGVGFLEFPSPEMLKNKILISTKPPLESLDSLKEQELDERKTDDSISITVPILANGDDTKNIQEADVETKQNDELEDEDEEEVAVPEYRNLIAIHAIKVKGELETLLKHSAKGVARLSMSERKLQNVVRTQATDIIRFTQRNLLRVYPKGARFLSSNYDPLLGWTHGAQMVAFNLQGYGKQLSIMQGLFRANGGCGYVKKPHVLLSDKAFNPNIKDRVKKILKVKVYMGEGWHLQFRQTHFDPLSPPDFFTKLEILGVPADRKKVQTNPIEDQWIPIWNDEFEFPLSVPDLALLRIEVLEFDTTRRHDFGGQNCLPISELRSGIRAIPLYSKEGERYKHVKLLMQFQFQIVVGLD